MTITCPICTTESTRMREGTPYHMCHGCGCWWQDPLPAKIFHGPEEPGVEAMPESEQQVNRDLAADLFANAMGTRPGPMLDIGSKIPVLAAAFKALGCSAFAIDGVGGVEFGGVTSIPLDFESPEAVRWVETPGGYRLISMVHVFEHMLDPLGTLRKLRKLVADDGRVFLRIPDNSVPGYEHDLTPHHYSIHPFYHCLSDVCEMLWRLGDAFVIEGTRIPCSGQRDLILKPITQRPTIGVGLIVKNEERDLPRMLRSIEAVADGIVVVDTGSTDRTLVVAHTTIDKPVWSRVYLGASRQDDDGEWRLWNFAQARNEYVREVRERGFSHLLWMDADDELKTPLAVRRAAYLPPSVVGIWIELGGSTRQIHHRMWPASFDIKFKGWCHEFPVIDGYKDAVLNDACIAHDATPHGSETSNARNLRILEAQYASEPDSRTAFYLANTHKDGGRFHDAAHWYHVRLGYGDAWKDEYLFAVLYLARSLRAAGDDDGAREAARYGLALAPEWSEFRMELAFAAYVRKDYATAIDTAVHAVNTPAPITVLWREPQMYKDQPARLISWSHEHMGNLPHALEWSRQATRLIGAPDHDWSQREALLEARVHADSLPQSASAVVTRPQRRRIALHRPGAIGDILMTLNLLPAFREANPDAEIHYFCHPALGGFDALGLTMMAAGVDLIMDASHLGAWRNDYERVIDLVGYPMAEGYPYKPMKKHLLQYFGAELGLEIDALPQLTLARPKRPAGLPEHYATLQIKAGWSPYKNWPRDRWAQVVLQNPDVAFVQIGAAGEPLVPGALDYTGRTLHEAIAVVGNATIHVGVDSFANHLTNYLWIDRFGGRSVPGVIVWGSTQGSAAGYPNNINVSDGIACQPCFREDPAISRQRVDPCPNLDSNGVHRCMNRIGVPWVVSAVQRKWRAALGEQAAA